MLQEIIKAWTRDLAEATERKYHILALLYRKKRQDLATDLRWGTKEKEGSKIVKTADLNGRAERDIVERYGNRSGRVRIG